MKSNHLIGFSALVISAVLCLSSCILGKADNDMITIKLVNGTDHALEFSDVENAGDGRFFPASSFSLSPHGAFMQVFTNVVDYDPKTIAPKAMTIEYNGKCVSLNNGDKSPRNPCRAENWTYYSNHSKYRPAIDFEFTILESDLEEFIRKNQLESAF